MEVTLKWEEPNNQKHSKMIEAEAEEGAFWKAVAEVIATVVFPCTFDVACAAGDARLEISERDSHYVNGVAVPSMFVAPVSNTIDLPALPYPERYLTCANPETKGGHGSYKFYRMFITPDGEGVGAEYGRIGGRAMGIKPYPRWLFWPKYVEKLTKGYVDQSDVYLVADATPDADGNADAVQTPTDIGGVLYMRLLAMAKQRVRTSLVQGTSVTEAQVVKSEAMLQELRKQLTVIGFNDTLLSLMQIAPRVAPTLRYCMALTERDFARIISSEESLVQAMRAVVDARHGIRSDAAGDSFATHGVLIREATKEEIEEEVMTNLSSRLQSLVKAVYAVEPETQRKRFEDHCSRRGIDEGKRKLLWHGSRNENWCSIVVKSLLLNPDAVRTGSMFGPGLYFSMEGCGGRGEKSWGYTSYRGSYWARGSSDCAFMGLYECAYGKPYTVTSSGWHTKETMAAAGTDCLHAYPASGGLRNEEIVFYDEEAVVLKYLVEFAA